MDKDEIIVCYICERIIDLSNIALTIIYEKATLRLCNSCMFRSFTLLWDMTKMAMKMDTIENLTTESQESCSKIIIPKMGIVEDDKKG